MADYCSSTLVDTVRSPPTENLINSAALIFEELRNTHWQPAKSEAPLMGRQGNFYAPNLSLDEEKACRFLTIFCMYENPEHFINKTTMKEELCTSLNILSPKYFLAMNTS